MDHSKNKGLDQRVSTHQPLVSSAKKGRGGLEPLLGLVVKPRGDERRPRWWSEVAAKGEPRPRVGWPAGLGARVCTSFDAKRRKEEERKIQSLNEIFSTISFK